MTLDNDIDTSINLRSDYRDSSINDSVFFSSSISIDVICLISVNAMLLLTIGLFLRLVKRITVLENEIVVILRVFSEESHCYEIEKGRITHLLDYARKILKIWNPICFSVKVQEEVSLNCWLNSQLLFCKWCSNLSLCWNLRNELTGLQLVRKWERTCISNTISLVNTVVKCLATLWV